MAKTDHKSLKLLTGSLLILLLPSLLWAKANPITLWTTHPQVAYDLNQIAKIYAPQSQTTSAPVAFFAQEVYSLTDSADLHQFEPTATELKKLLKHTPLISGPLSHQPWLRLAKNSGLLPQKNGLILDHLGQTDHYWLNSEEALAFEKKIQSFLKELNIETPSGHPWSESIAKETKKIQKLIKSKKIKRIVLAHNALLPLFESIPKLEVLVLYTGDHHQEIAANILKKVYRWAENKEDILFIYERNITWPAPLKETRFNGIRTIQWSPVAPSPLTHLRVDLEALP